MTRIQSKVVAFDDVTVLGMGSNRQRDLANILFCLVAGSFGVFSAWNFDVSSSQWPGQEI